MGCLAMIDTKVFKIHGVDNKGLTIAADSASIRESFTRSARNNLLFQLDSHTRVAHATIQCHGLSDGFSYQSQRVIS